MKVCKQAQQLLQANMAIARDGVLRTLVMRLSRVEQRANRSLLQSILLRIYLCTQARGDQH